MDRKQQGEVTMSGEGGSNHLFDLEFINEIASAVAARLPKAPSQRWPELMSIETAAEYMGREPGGVRHLLEAKLLPCCRIDRRVQIRRADIDRLMERHTS